MSKSTRQKRIDEIKLRAKKKIDLEKATLFFQKAFGEGLKSSNTEVDYPTKEIWEQVPSNSVFKKVYFKDSNTESFIDVLKSVILEHFKTSQSIYIERQSTINYMFLEVSLDSFLQNIANYYKIKNYHFYDLFIDSFDEQFIVLWEDQESKYVEIYLGDMVNGKNPNLK